MTSFLQNKYLTFLNKFCIVIIFIFLCHNFVKMRHMKLYRLIFVAFALIALVNISLAVPAFREPVTITQPDGTTLTIRLYGDEFRKVRTTIDGYIIRENVQGFYAYAVRDTDNRLVAGQVIARDPEKRTPADKIFLNKVQKMNSGADLHSIQPVMSKMKRVSAVSASTGFPKTGSPSTLVIMVNFSDKSFVVSNPLDQFTRLLNQQDYSDNGGTGSARDYFRAASNGQFSPQFDVVGPYNLTNNMAYYGANDTNGDDDKPAYLIVDACKAADDAGIDFSQYDTDGDGFVDNVFVYYAGYNEAEGGPSNTIWPHRWAVQPGFNFTNNQNLIRFDGKMVFDYACSSELKGNSGTNMCGIGTFVHEFGHVIGLPDYYHTEADKPALDYWSVMDAGAYLNQGRTPPAYSAYDRFYLGWLTPQQLTTPADMSLYPLSQSRTPLTSTAKQAYLLSATNHNLNGTSPSPVEFYIMEYRRKVGWDAFLPAEGLLFWHIDYNQTAWDNNTVNNYSGATQTASSHMRVYLQPLSGYTTTPGTAFTTGSFTPLTWSGTNINRPISNIVRTNDSISFKIMGGAPVDPNAPVIRTGVIDSQLVFPTIKSGTQIGRQLNIRTTDVTGNLTVVLSGVNAASWQLSASQITAAEANSGAGAIITVTFRPTTVGQHTATLTISGGGLSPEKVITLSGQAN